MACLNGLYKRLKRLVTSNDMRNNEPLNSLGCEDGSVTVHVNPFAPIDENSFDGILNFRKETSSGISATLNGCARKVLRFTESSDKEDQKTVSLTLSLEPLDLRSTSVARFRQEFKQLELVGCGEFGSVYRCLNRLDGCVYAVKRSQPLGRSKFAQRRASNEIHANAVLNGHKNIVRYFSAWIEEDRMSIQQEYCNSGDLGEVIERMRKKNLFFEESELKRMLLQVADGLRYIHALKLAHMDIKPENIFITKEKTWKSKCQSNCEDSNNSSTSLTDSFEEEIIYKIGDLGHVASIVNTLELEDEGDCRYLSKEILREDYSDLAKADVFSLGLTIYDAAGGGPLPKNGPNWQDIRNGNLKKLTRYSDELNELMRVMVDSDPQKRPSAAEIMRYQFLFDDN